MRKLRIKALVLLGVAALRLVFPGTAGAQSTEDRVWETLLGPSRELQGWPRHFRLGALVGFNLKAKFSMGGNFDLSGNNPGPIGVSGANHTYDDGYVLLDATSNSGGRTWNWGYHNTNQYQSGRLFFNAVESYSTGSSAVEESSGAEAGIDLAYGGHLKRWGKALVGWEVGFGWLPVSIKDDRPMSATVSRVTHSFDTGGILVPGRQGAAGQNDSVYAGTFNGPGAAIPDVAQDEGTAILSNIPLTGERTLEVDVFSFRLGPTLHWEIHPRFAVAVSGGAALGIISGDLGYHETLTFSDGSTAVNQGKTGSTEIAYGGYVAATLLYHAVKNGDFYLGFQYMPMTSTTFSGGGREAELDLTGALSISAGINWPF